MVEHDAEKGGVTVKEGFHIDSAVEQVERRENLETSFESSHKHGSIVNCCDDKKLLFKTIASGQLLSLMLCSTGTAATALSLNYGIKTPCFYAFLMYTLLASTFGIYTITRKDFITMMKSMWWKYLLISICDVEANYLLTKAYAFTTLTSVQLCDSITIPTVMIVSFIFLRIRYKIIHYVGVAICISGAICLLFTDSGEKSDEGSNGSNEILGDAIAICAAVLYGISQVGQEFLVKKYSSKQFLGMIGIYGMILSSIQVAIIERGLISDIKWTWEIALIFAAFAVCQYLYYTVMPVVIKLSSATVVNLSLLTSDLYTLTVGLFLFGYKFSYLYFVAFSGIFIGLITYNIKPTPTAPPRKKKDMNRNNIGVEKLTTGTFAPDFTSSSKLSDRVVPSFLSGAKSSSNDSCILSEKSYLIRGETKDYIFSYSSL